jgi:CHAT domain-containing protein
LFSFEKFSPVDLERIQKELHSTDTILLEYALGDDHSYLWAVTSNSSDSYILPARREIEDAAREFFKVITARQGSDDQSEKDYQADIAAADNRYSEKASNLSQMLLGPVIEKLGSRRIVIVTDGALQYIPFEALPTRLAEPTGPIEASTSFLIATNEVVVLPSASTLIAIRGAQNHKGSPGKLVAIIADPVFSSSDNRVPQEATADQNSDQAQQQTVKKLRLARLAHASEEADAISTAAPWGTTLVAKGFDASRETVMSSEVSRAQIVHFATHGFLDTEHPELSALVLTMMDRDGAKTNGLMPLPDIYTLDLSAELIVLSACQTALGKDIKGEGLVGLTHSFMSAGAKSVVASLWKVDDRATAALMADFYEGMLQKGMTPAAALRSAKLKMMSQKQWSPPYYWAGFELQGEYTNHIAVDRYSWLRPSLIVLFVLVLIATALLVFQKRRRQIRPAQFT